LETQIKAVILAGGAGERLRPLTSAIPKALAPINGVPMLGRQIAQLQELGITEVIVLTGYRSDMIHDYVQGAFSDESVRITCVDTPSDYSPAERLLESRAEIGSNFLLLYCDNLIGDIETIRSVINSREAITFLVEKRKVGNVSIDPSVKYSPARNTEAPYVELGYLHVNTQAFFYLMEKGTSLPETLHAVSSIYTCAAYITSSPLMSTSTMERFNTLRSIRSTILLDRDGILNHSMPPREYVSKIDQYISHEENLSTIVSELSNETDFIVITNQPGISTGEVTPEFLDKLHSKIVVELLIRGISVIGLYFCPHHWDENCECRKPKPGMLNQAISDYGLNRANILYLGDEPKDLEAADKAGIAGVRISNTGGEHTYSSILDAVFYIKSILGR
jgi:histidinol-phosphate phosphatase family protein